jgi:hypothetical protein
MNESGKRHGEACASRRLGQSLLVVSLPPSGGGRSPFIRTSHGQLPASSDYLAFALAAAAAVAEGSAKAITASPSIPGGSIGLPPKP